MLKELEGFIERVVEYLDGDVTIILFGSYARGDYNLASDIDLIVISDRLKGNPLERTKKLYELNSDFLSLDLLAYRKKEFLKALESLSPSALDAMVEGKVFYDNGFYRVAKRFFENLRKKGIKEREVLDDNQQMNVVNDR